MKSDQNGNAFSLKLRFHDLKADKFVYGLLSAKLFPCLMEYVRIVLVLERLTTGRRPAQAARVGVDLEGSLPIPGNARFRNLLRACVAPPVMALERFIRRIPAQFAVALEKRNRFPRTLKRNFYETQLV